MATHGQHPAGRTAADELYEAIAEGRRLDAMEMVRRDNPQEHFPTLAMLRRNFPHRVPEITDRDRAK